MLRFAAAVALLVALSSAAEVMEDRRVLSVKDAPSSQDVVPTAAQKVGVDMNEEGDLEGLTSSLLLNSLIWLGCLLAFSLLRVKFPKVYSNNVLRMDVPPRLVPSRWPLGWIVASLRMTTGEAFERCGLDAAMFVEFTHLCMRILALIGVPSMIMVTPLCWAFDLHRPTEDHLVRIQMEKLQKEEQWLHYLVACLVWFTVIVTRKSIFNAQARFLSWRFEWLRGLPRPRRTTLLLNNIPEECQQDAKLRRYFEEMFGPGAIQSATVVKRNSALLELTARWELVKNKLHAAKMQFEKGGVAPKKRIRSPGCNMAEVVAAIPHYEDELRLMAPMIRMMRKSLLKKEAEQVGGGGVNTSNGFVTFTRRRDAEIAQVLLYSANRDEWQMSMAPDPQSVLWKDLRHGHERVLQLRELLGYGCIAGLMSGYLVIVTTITNIARLIDLSDLGLPNLQPLWEAFAPTLGMQLVVSFLPTILLFIFRTFFVLNDESWTQHKLQIWYFWIQVVYVILVGCIGRSLHGRMRQILESPITIFHLLAEALPGTTHFYMNYLLLQWSANGTNILRILNLVKYLLLRSIYPEEEARILSEPENQDYFGIGSRSARFSLNMLIGIIFSTISPLIALLAFANFALCRVQYGYLIMFAETRKPDLGGVFWVSQLQHVQFGVMIYCCLMIGMLVDHSAGDCGPSVIAVSALLFAIWSYRRFHQLFKWVRLPLNQIDADDDADEEAEVWNSEAYLQPELQEDPELAHYMGNRDEDMENGGNESDSTMTGIVKVLSSGAEAARHVGGLMKNMGLTIDQAILGTQYSEVTRSTDSKQSSFARTVSPSTDSKQSSFARTVSPVEGAQVGVCHVATPPDIKPEIGICHVATQTPPEEKPEIGVCHVATPSRPPRMPSPPPSAPSTPRSSFSQERFGNDWSDVDDCPVAKPYASVGEMLTTSSSM